MSDDLKATLDKALSRIAALESERSARPAQVPASPTADARAMIADPVGYLGKLGVPVDHITKILVAHAMGEQAPAELRMLAQMGPQAAQTMALSSDLAAVRQRLEAIDAKETKEATRKSFSALAVDKVKYPLLAAAIAKSPALYDEDVDSHKGDAAALADKLEGRLKATADALGYTPPASSENADNQQAQSQQGKQAQSEGKVITTPPATKKPGVFTQEDHQELRDRIVRQFGTPAVGA